MTARSTRGILTLALAALTATALSACGPEPLNASTSGDAASTQLSLVGFAVPKAANDAAQAAFAKTDAGAGTTWTTSYGASGDQSRAVESGLDADYVHFSLTGDVTRLVDAGLVDESWDDGEHKGIVSDSVVVLVVREGNPKNIQGWDDLVRDDVSIVSPNPGSSGSARWNILAAYGSVLAKGGTRRRRPSTSRSSSRTSPHSPAPAVTRRRRSRPAPATSSSPTRTRRSSRGRTARPSTTSSPPRRSSSRTRPPSSRTPTPRPRPTSTSS